VIAGGLETAHTTIADHEEDTECVVELLSKVCPVHGVGGVVEYYVVSDLSNTETTNDFAFTFFSIQLN
jgi:hypothetical protein